MVITLLYLLNVIMNLLDLGPVARLYFTTEVEPEIIGRGHNLVEWCTDEDSAARGHVGTGQNKVWTVRASTGRGPEQLK